MHKFLTILLCLLMPVIAFSAPMSKQERRQRAKEHVKMHLKPYGFVRNYFSVDTRETLAGTGDLFTYLPKDEQWNQTKEEALTSGIKREDLNRQTSFRFLSLTTRAGLDICYYRWGRTQFGGKIEADFYAGLTGSTGTALLRLRQAYITLAWDSLKLGHKSHARIDMLLGQTWHPLSADLPEVIGLNSGAPFNPFSRTPQIKMDAHLGQMFSITAAALWQMQYTSTGPQGASADYIKYACTPEAYIGISFQHQSGVTLRLGADMLSIKPRHTGVVLGADNEPVSIKVSDRITTLSPFAYFRYTHGNFSLQAKTVLAQAGEHLMLNGGYGISSISADGTYRYTASRSTSTWLCLSYGNKIKGLLFAGYVRNLGTKKALHTNELGEITGYFFSKNSYQNLNRLWRLSPTVLWTIGRFQLGAEYEVTSAQYGTDFSAANALAESNMHWVTNHRVQLMTRLNF